MTTVFNKNDYNNNNTGYDDDDSMYINRNGDVMNGSLSMPYIVLTSSENPIHFLDGTYQNTAFNETNEIIVNMQSDISGCIFATENVKTKTTNISYSGSLLNKTTISNNCFITNLQCGNINTSHLSNTTSNLQTEINNLNEITQHIFVNGDTTYIEKDLLIAQNLMFTDESTQLTAFTESHYNAIKDITYNQKTIISNNCYINSLECGNINTSHLSGTTSNLQTQINNVSLKSTFTDTPIIINNSVFDNTIATFDQPDYDSFGFNEGITLRPISSYRTYHLGIIGNDSTNTNQFAIGVDGGGVPDPNILMSLSTTSAYFFGVKQPLVPVGAIQIFAGAEAPNGYLLCQGQEILKSEYSKLWDLIGNTYLNGRQGGQPHFYLPDLRGVFIRGVGLSTAYSPNVTGGTLGQFQTHSVQDHYHKYSRPNDSITVGGSNSVSSNSVWDNSVATSTTQGGVYDESGDLLVAETRPANISMNYIIKF